jgi:hypothetical protein
MRNTTESIGGQDEQPVTLYQNLPWKCDPPVVNVYALICHKKLNSFTIMNEIATTVAAPAPGPTAPSLVMSGGPLAAAGWRDHLQG